MRVYNVENTEGAEKGGALNEGLSEMWHPFWVQRNFGALPWVTWTAVTPRLLYFTPDRGEEAKATDQVEFNRKVQPYLPDNSRSISERISETPL